MDIAQIRSKYPQYSDLSDKQLADALHQKFYSDIPIKDYYEQIGFVGDTKRTWGEAGTDIGAALVSGAGAALQFPGQLVGLVPGMRGFGETLAAPGERLAEYGKSLKSEGLKAREALRSKALSEAEKDGVLAEFATAIKSTISDPALLSTFLTEQVPQLIGPAGAAKVTTMLGKGALEAAAEGAAREAAAKALGKKATAAAVGTGAVMQGADIGEETYKEAYKLAKEQNLSEEDARAVALQKARVAALEAGAISLAAQRLPGARAIERKLAGIPGEGRIKSLLGEAGSEMVEEGGGAFAKNVGLQEIDPTRSLTAGIGTAAGLGAIGGAGLGGAFGGRGRTEAPAAPGAVPGELPIERARREAAEEAAQKAAAAPAPAAPPEIPPMPDTWADLMLYGEKLKQLPKSPERDTAIKESKEKLRALTIQEVEAGRLSKERATQFMTAEEAATAEMQRRDELEIPEPTVREEAAPTPVLDQEQIKAAGFGKSNGPKSIYQQLLGKDMSSPEDVQAVRTVLENYKQSKTANEKTVAKVDAFLAKLPAVEVPTTEVADVGKVVTEPSGAGVPVAGVAGTEPTAPGAGVTEPSGVVRPPEDVGQPAVGETTAPSAVTAPPAITAPPAKRGRPATGSIVRRVTDKNVNAAFGGVPDVKVIRETLANEDPRMYNAAMLYLGMDPEGHFLTGANNLPQVFSLKEAAEASGLGKQSATLSRVLTAMNLTPEVRRKYLASQTEAVVTGKDVSEAGTGANIETPQTALIENQKWYEPIKKKGLDKANDTELARAAVQADQFLANSANESTHAQIMGEVQKRAKRPEFRMQLRREFDIQSKEVERIPEEEQLPGQEDEVDRFRSRDVTPPAKAISEAELRKIAGNIEKMLGGKANITILGSVTDVDPNIEAGSKAGGLLGGKLYLFRDGIPDGLEGEKTIFHELFHKGLRNLTTPKEYAELMAKLYNQSANIRQLANAWIASPAGKEARLKKEPVDVLRAEAVEEVLAEMAEQTKLKPALLTQLRRWFADVAEKFGLKELAKSIRTMGMNPLEEFIHDALRASVQGETTVEPAVEPVAGEERYRTTPQQEPIGEKEDRGFRQSVDQMLGSKKVQGLRAKLTDSLAAVDAFFAEKYGGRVKDNTGNANPVVMLSRALDAQRFSKVVQEEGTLKRGEDGLLIAGDLNVNAENFSPEDLAKLNLVAGENISYLDALKEAKDLNISKEQLGRMLIAHREHGLRELVRKNQSDYKQTLSDEEIDKLERQFQQSRDIQRISQMLDGVRFSMINTMQTTGRIDAKTAAEWKDATGYIPFSRIDKLDGFYNPTTGAQAKRGLAVYRNMRELSGDPTRQLENPLDAFSGLIDWMTKESMVTDATSRALQEMSLFNAAQRIPAREAVANNQQGAVVETYMDGRKVLFYVPDPALLGAFTQAPVSVSSTVQALQKGSRVLRAGVTTMPPFVIKQVVDDITRMYAFAGLKNNTEAISRALMNMPKFWFQELTGRKSATVKALEARGLVGTYDFTETGNVKSIMAESGLGKRSFTEKLVHWMEAGAKASDLAVRQSIYEQVLKETGSTAEAENRAREIINFSRRGNARMMDYMIRVVPFFNAFARGTDKLLVAASGGKLGVGESIGQPRSVFWKRMSTLTAMATMYALMMSDDDEYNKLPDNIRDRNIILPFNKEFVQKYGVVPAIPLPADLAFIFKSIPERVIQYYKLYGTPEERSILEITAELAKQGYNVFATPNVTPQLLRPIVENMINHSFFLDRPLESQMQISNYRPFQRYGAGTSDVAKQLAAIGEDISVRTGTDITAISPIKIENFIRGLLGTIGGTALAVGDALINPSRTDRPLQQQLLPQLTGASTFMKDGTSSRFVDEMYKLDRSAAQAFSTHKRLEETDPKAAAKFLASNYGIYSARDQIRSLMKEIQDTNKLAMDIDKMTDLTPDQRRNAIIALKLRQNDFARRAYEIRRQAATLQMQIDKAM